MYSGGYKAVDHVAHIREVTGFLAGTKYSQFFAFERAVDENRYDIAVFTGNFARAVDIKEPRDCHGEFVVVVEKVAVELAEQFGYLIRGVEVDGYEILFERQGRVRAVDAAARRGENKALDFVVAAVLEYLKRTHAVHHEVVLRMINAVLVGEESSKVEDVVGFVRECCGEYCVVGNRTLDKGDARVFWDIPLVCRA